MLDFLVSVLAVLRLYYLFAHDNGPADLLAKFRLRVGIRYENNVGAIPTNNFAFGLLCPFCSTLWYGTFIGVLVAVNKSVTRLLTLPLALSMAAILVDACYKKLER